METIKINVVAVLAVLFLASCATVPSATPSGPRSIILNEKTYSETDLGRFNSWSCKDYASDAGIFASTLVEVGSFTNTNLEGTGFILYDGSYSGESTKYQRKGINHRWDWGPNGSEYTFVIKPDGTGFFYDFSSSPLGESVQANEVYKCYRS